MLEVWQEGPTCAGGRGGQGGRCVGPAGTLGPDQEPGDPGCVWAPWPRVTHSREGPHRSGRASHPPKHSGKERGRAGVWGERRAPERRWSAGSPAQEPGCPAPAPRAASPGAGGGLCTTGSRWTDVQTRVSGVKRKEMWSEPPRRTQLVPVTRRPRTKATGCGQTRSCQGGDREGTL